MLALVGVTVSDAPAPTRRLLALALEYRAKLERRDGARCPLWPLLDEIVRESGVAVSAGERQRVQADVFERLWGDT